MLFYKARAVVFGLIIVFVSTGCASLGLYGTPEEQVTRRAQGRLDALMQRDFEKAFTYVAPALRETTTWGRHGSKYAGVVNWSEATVKSAACGKEACDVEYVVSYDMGRSGHKNTRPLTSVWIKVGRQWYLYDQ